MLWYQSDGIFQKITPVEVVRETKTQVVYFNKDNRKFRCSKRHSSMSFFKEKKEAFDWLLEKITRSLEFAQRKVNYYEKEKKNLLEKFPEFNEEN